MVRFRCTTLTHDPKYSFPSQGEKPVKMLQLFLGPTELLSFYQLFINKPCCDLMLQLHLSGLWFKVPSDGLSAYMGHHEHQSMSTGLLLLITCFLDVFLQTEICRCVRKSDLCIVQQHLRKCLTILYKQKAAKYMIQTDLIIKVWVLRVVKNGAIGCCRKQWATRLPINTL